MNGCYKEILTRWIYLSFYTFAQDLYVHLTFYLPLSWHCITWESTLVYHVSYEMYHLIIGNN